MLQFELSKSRIKCRKSQTKSSTSVLCIPLTIQKTIHYFLLLGKALCKTWGLAEAPAHPVPLVVSFHQALKEHAPKDSPRTPVVWWSTHLLLYELISFQINDIPIFWKYLTDLQLAMLPKTVKRRTRLPSHPDKITCKKNNWLHNPNYIWYFFLNYAFLIELFMFSKWFGNIKDIVNASFIPCS